MRTEFNFEAQRSMLLRAYRKIDRAPDFYYPTLINTPRINNQIVAEQLRVISESGANLGVMSRAEAFRKAQELNLDIIEISPQANPPVARIMSFDKYRYQEEKKRKKQQAAQKNQGLKQVQIGARTALNDLSLKAKKANEFMAAGHPLNIVLVLRGREKGNQEWAHKKLGEFLSLLNPHRIIAPAKFMGRGIQVQVTGQPK
jgi:translation initiation factor IF-3